MLRDYIDRLRAEWLNSRKIRQRIIEPNNFSENEVSAPLLAPSWTRAGYKGHLKEAVIKACNQENKQHKQPEQHNELADDVLSILSKTYGNEHCAGVGEDGKDGKEEEEVKDGEEGEGVKDGEEEVEVEEVEEVMLTSSDNQPIHSDDDYLEMDD